MNVSSSQSFYTWDMRLFEIATEHPSIKYILIFGSNFDWNPRSKCCLTRSRRRLRLTPIEFHSSFVAPVTLGNEVILLWTVDLSMQAMTDPKELDELCPGESKRQREALRRKLERGGHKCGIDFWNFRGQNIESSHHELRSKHDRLQASSQDFWRSSPVLGPTLRSSLLRSWYWCSQSESQYIVVAHCFEVWSAQTVHHGPFSGIRHGRDALCWATISAGICSVIRAQKRIVLDSLLPARQAKEKSKGEWIEKSLCDLEKQYSSPEDREWLENTIVKSKPPSFLRITFCVCNANIGTFVGCPLSYACWGQPGIPHPQASSSIFWHALQGAFVTSCRNTRKVILGVTSEVWMFGSLRILRTPDVASTKCLNTSSTPAGTLELCKRCPKSFWPLSSFFCPGERIKVSGTSIRASAAVPKNKAMRQALADHVTGAQAEFETANNAFVPEGSCPKPKPKPKQNKKVHFHLLIFALFL